MPAQSYTQLLLQLCHRGNLSLGSQGVSSLHLCAHSRSLVLLFIPQVPHYSDGYFYGVLRALAVVSLTSPPGLCRDGRNYLCSSSTLILCSPLPGDWLYCYRRLSLSFHNFHGAEKLSLHRLCRFEATAVRKGSNWTIAEMPVSLPRHCFYLQCTDFGFATLLLPFCRSSSAARWAFGSLWSIWAALVACEALGAAVSWLPALLPGSSHLCWLHTEHPSLHNSGLA